MAESSRDPAIAPLVRPSRLGRCYVIVRKDAEPLLAFMTPMERGEAAATGLALLEPEALDLARWSRGDVEASEMHAQVVSRGLQLAGASATDGPLALAGRPPADDVLALVDLLEAEGWQLERGESIVRSWRKSKSQHELEELRRTGTVVEQAFRRVAEILSQAEGGDSLRYRGTPLELDLLRHEIASIFARGGLEQTEGSIVAAAEQSAVPHSTGDRDRILRVGESLIVDLFPRDRLFADCTRTFCVGEPPAALARAHRVTRAALAASAGAARPGVSAWSLQKLVCKEIEAAGFPTQLSHPGTVRGYVHGLGHGVGYELHELPLFADSSSTDGLLEEGDVFTLEPGLYDPDQGWGVRLEDLLCMGSKGRPELLIDLPYDLDPRAW